MLYKQLRVLKVVVVEMSHPRWGESPYAFIAIKKNSLGKTHDVCKAKTISYYCRKNLPHLIPKKVEFLLELP
jgi:acyl-coenzyme A synthetase/AMP-(fatty) acid ligase